MNQSREQTGDATVEEKEVVGNMAKALWLRAGSSPTCSTGPKGPQGLIWLTSSASTETKLQKRMSTCGYLKQKTYGPLELHLLLLQLIRHREQIA